MNKILLYLFLFVQFSICAQESIDNTLNYKLGDVFPEFELKTLDNKVIKSSDLKGKTIFINTWFTACQPCVREIPELNQLQYFFGDQVAFLAISPDNPEKTKAFIKKHPFSFHHLPGNRPFLTKEIGVKYYPKIIIINKKGIIRFISDGIQFEEVIIDGEKKVVSEYASVKKALSKIISE